MLPHLNHFEACLLNQIRQQLTQNLYLQKNTLSQIQKQTNKQTNKQKNKQIHIKIQYNHNQSQYRVNEMINYEKNQLINNSMIQFCMQLSVVCRHSNQTSEYNYQMLNFL
ncbi:hypothetical protein ABPG72_015699 [Tetrahymena utriculariae]